MLGFLFVCLVLFYIYIYILTFCASVQQWAQPRAARWEQGAASFCRAEDGSARPQTKEHSTRGEFPAGGGHSAAGCSWRGVCWETLQPLGHTAGKVPQDERRRVRDGGVGR